MWNIKVSRIWYVLTSIFAVIKMTNKIDSIENPEKKSQNINITSYRRVKNVSIGRKLRDDETE